ncbi:hypothetical protein KSS87_008116 [Heliosperma pusillum]|nr:hypothetical protein KSS87_008116 [Heliosperma pusillum]
MGRLALISIGIRKSELMTGWWDEINESTQWQDIIFFTLSGAYALVSAIALIQLIRIQLRVPQYGWTTQKVFHLMNFIVNGVRAAIFGFHMYVFILKPKVLTMVLLDLPGLLFFTTYTLLVLFWAEIYYQARSLPTDKLRAWYISVNCVIYVIQMNFFSLLFGYSCGGGRGLKGIHDDICPRDWGMALIWIYLWLYHNSFVGSMSQVFIAVVSFIAALGFLLFGGRLFFMLRRFPIESKGRRKKLHEVGSITAICFVCFLIRCFMVALSAFNADLSLRVLDHPILDLIYYTFITRIRLAIDMWHIEYIDDGLWLGVFTGPQPDRTRQDKPADRITTYSKIGDWTGKIEIVFKYGPDWTGPETGHHIFWDPETGPIQFIRLLSSLRQNGWSTQKVFFLMNTFVNSVRAAVFGFHMYVVVLKPKVLASVLVDLPGLLTFSIYTLLVTFWAEIWYQAKNRPTDNLKAWYSSVNCVIYAIQVLIWISLCLYDNNFVRSVSQVFNAVTSIIVVSGFLLFGRRLSLMLIHFPIESKGRRRKLREVLSLTAICLVSFLIRCITAAMSAYNADAPLKVLNHPTAFGLYYYMDTAETLLLIKKSKTGSRKVLNFLRQALIWIYLVTVQQQFCWIHEPSIHCSGVFYCSTWVPVVRGKIIFYAARFPTESKGRRKKLHEVALSAFNADLSLRVLDHPILDLI